MKVELVRFVGLSYFFIFVNHYHIILYFVSSML